MGEGNPVCVGFIPDGSRIRFQVDNTQGKHTLTLWDVRPDGTDLHQLLRGWPRLMDIGYNWTPDGRYFIFSAETGNGSHDLFALRESAGFLQKQSNQPTRLTFGPIRWEMPTMSPDGKTLFAQGWHERGELVHYDSASKQFVPFLGGISATNITFSRDGKWVAYNTIPGYDLWRSRVDGSDRLQLTSSAEGAMSLLPNWSPDGKHIEFTSVAKGNLMKIFLISADGGKPEPLLSESTLQSGGAWSPDGTQIAFSTGTLGGTKSSEIEILNLGTHKASVLPGSNGKFGANRSPDGRYLSAGSFERHVTKIFLYDFRTQKWNDWFADEDIGYSNWTADGRYFQYVRNQFSGDPMVRRVKVGDSHPEDLYDLKGLRQLEGPFGMWSNPAPDGSQMFVRDASGRDIYALDVNFP
jgi:Tol biopolymer transport system component